MPSVREGQAQDLLKDLDRRYHAFVRMPNTPWFGPEDRAARRADLQASLQRAQSALALMDGQPGLSAELQYLKDKLILLTTVAEADLQQAPRR